MQTNFFLILLGLSLFPGAVLAVDNKPIDPKAKSTNENTPTTEYSAGEFRIDKKLMASLYDMTVEEARGPSQEKLNSSLISPQIGIVKMTNVELKNDYFNVSYTDNLSTLPVFSIALGSPNSLFRLGQFDFYAIGNLGYGYSEGVYEVESENGLLLKDTVQTHWVPLVASIKTEYSGIKRIVKPSLLAGAGAQWISQSGKLDGMQQGFWIPMSQLGVGLTFFDFDGSERSDYFQGVSLGAHRQTGFMTSQAFSTWMFDLGTNLVL
jgi:hypothetical protein